MACNGHNAICWWLKAEEPALPLQKSRRPRQTWELHGMAADHIWSLCNLYHLYKCHLYKVYVYICIYIYKLKIIVTSYDMYMICIESIWIIYTLPKSISILQLAVLFARAFSTMPRSSSVRNASYGSEPCISGASANVKSCVRKPGRGLVYNVYTSSTARTRRWRKFQNRKPIGDAWLLWITDGRSESTDWPKGVGVVFAGSGCNGCSGHLTHNCWM